MRDSFVERDGCSVGPRLTVQWRGHSLSFAGSTTPTFRARAFAIFSRSSGRSRSRVFLETNLCRNGRVMVPVRGRRSYVSNSKRADEEANFTGAVDFSSRPQPAISIGSSSCAEADLHWTSDWLGGPICARGGQASVFQRRVCRQSCDSGHIAFAVGLLKPRRNQLRRRLCPENPPPTQRATIRP